MNKEKIVESLSINEIKILPHIKEENVNLISEKSNLDKVSVLRALEYLQNKKIVLLSSQKTKVIDLGINGILYRGKGLPERRIMNLLKDKRVLNFKDVPKLASLSDEEFKASIGILKRKSIINLKNNN